MIDSTFFKKNAIFIYTIIGLIQLFYLTVLCVPNYAHIVLFFSLFAIGFVILEKVGAVIFTSQINSFQSKIFICIFIAVFTSIIVSSRLPIINNTIKFGLSNTRGYFLSDAYSYFSIINAMFFPLGMLLIFYKNCIEKYVMIASVIVVCLADIIFIGARNSSFFMFVYYFIFLVDIRYFNKTKIVIIFACVLSIILLFEASTRIRSGFVGDPSEYWLPKIFYSNISDSSYLNVNAIIWLSELTWMLLPIIYLIMYISHSIADFYVFLINYNSYLVPTFAHLLDQLALYTGQDRSINQDIISVMRVRSGYYQTAYASIIIDYGFIIFIFPLIYIILKKSNMYYAVNVLLLVFTSLSLIENYFYQGLKPLHFFYFLVYYWIFVRKNIMAMTRR
ncbi:hypothetical protein ACK6D9_08135 [Hoeflea sp. Naph1]|uniref:hypothetical protein n=1 Tax=Hoeflea sp. Naph1 TaxID=3388653 RepID=UPI00398F9564